MVIDKICIFIIYQAHSTSTVWCRNVIVAFLITTSTYHYVVQTISSLMCSVFLDVLLFPQHLVVEPSIYLLNYIAWLLIVLKRFSSNLPNLTSTWFFNPSTKETRLLLCDAQTSGGLLISVAPERLDELIRELKAGDVQTTAVIGGIVDKSSLGGARVEVLPWPGFFRSLIDKLTMSETGALAVYSQAVVLTSHPSDYCPFH